MVLSLIASLARKRNVLTPLLPFLFSGIFYLMAILLIFLNRYSSYVFQVSKGVSAGFSCCPLLCDQCYHICKHSFQNRFSTMQGCVCCFPLSIHTCTGGRFFTFLHLCLHGMALVGVSTPCYSVLLWCEHTFLPTEFCCGVSTPSSLQHSAVAMSQSAANKPLGCSIPTFLC